MGYLVIIAVSVLLNYLVYIILPRLKDRTFRRYILVLGLAANVGILLYFKYMDFFILTLNQILRLDYDLLGIVLPLGISFFTFQQISFIVDTYRGEVPQYGFLEYACFVTFFPQLIAGPIVTHDELIPQLQDREKKTINWDNLAKGIYIFVLGLSKKVLLADVFGNAANIGFYDVTALNTTNAILTMVSYTMQIYFDFSGYCDMAIGLGKMLNLDLPLNFNSPYKALTITEFWQKWHMTLTRFFTKYIYIPLGGNRKGNMRIYINVFIVFLISGFWHGAGFTFIFWGICHGVFSIVTRKYAQYFDKLHPALNWMLTFGFINITWMFFRADSMKDAVTLLNRIAVFDFGAINQDILTCFKLDEVEVFLSYLPGESRYPYLMMIVFFVVAFFIILGKKNSYEKMEAFLPSGINVVLTTVLLIWCITSFTGVSTFLYFNF